MKKSSFDIDYQQESIESKIIVSLERISEAFKTMLWEESKAHKLTPIQVQILIFCLFHPEEMRKVKQLASEFNVTKATISDAVKSLEHKKLITKNTESNDGRSYSILFTTQGKMVAQKVARFAEKFHPPLQNLPKEKKRILLETLLNTIDTLQSAGIISINRMCFSCKFYKKEHKKHYCRLLKKELKSQDLRIDCPEHAIAS